MTKKEQSKSGEMKTTTHTFRLDDELKAELSRCSKDSGVSAGKIIRKAIRYYIKNQTT